MDRLDAILLGVSTDSVERHRRFREAHGLPFPLIADPEKRVTRLYDVRRRFGLGTSRVTYVIDRAGVIRAAVHHELNIGRHPQAVLAILEEL